MKINVSRVARLANLPLSSPEKNSLNKQLEETLEYVNRLNVIDTSKVEETNEVNNLVNIWREDEVKPSLSQKEALMNARHIHNGFFVVPFILAEVTG
jgi:aspartyl-tRNA(Asn)/glutamyl-tRNA(Gln) amidotransferase subunit C